MVFFIVTTYVGVFGDSKSVLVGLNSLKMHLVNNKVNIEDLWSGFTGCTLFMVRCIMNTTFNSQESKLC